MNEYNPAANPVPMGSTQPTLRIAHVTNYQVPGYGYEEIQLAREQCRMGHDVTIVASNFLHPAGQYAVLQQRFPHRQVEPREEFVDGVRIRRLRGHEIAKRVWIHGLERALIEINPDVIHCHNLLQFHPVRIELMRKFAASNAALVVDDHMHAGFVRRTLSGRMFYVMYRRLMQPLVAGGIDRFTAIADDTREYLRRECGVVGKIDVVPLGVAVSDFAPDADRSQRARAHLGFSPSDLVLIYTGKVIPEKGVDLLVLAAKELRRNGDKVAVLIVGDADDRYRDSLADIARADDCELTIKILPSVEYDRLPDYYAAADVGAWPKQESMAVFEAMAAGLPTVVSAASGLAQTVSAGPGLVYEPETAEALAACLSRLRDKRVREEFGAAGRALTTTLSWAQSAQRYVEIYREAIAHRGSRGPT